MRRRYLSKPSLPRHSAQAVCRILVLLLACTAPSLAGQWVRHAELDGITEYRWPNGFRALLIPDETRPTITLNMTYLVGSREERYGETGVAHVLEHLLFESAVGHRDICRELGERGGYANGVTGADSTMYYETFAASNENIQWALDLEANRMGGASLEPSQLERTIGVVLNERNGDESDPDLALTERLFATAYAWHGYGRSAIGTPSDLARLDIDAVNSFYRRHYRPDNALLVLSGRFQPDDALRRIDAVFGPLTRPAHPLSKVRTVEPIQEGPRSIELRRAGPLQLVYAGYHIPAASHPDFAPLQILFALLAQAPEGWLHERLVAPGLAGSVFGWTPAMSEAGLAVAGATISGEAGLDEVRKGLLSVMEGAGRRRFSPHAVMRQKATAVARMNRVLRSTEDLVLEFGDWATVGDWRLFFLHRARLQQVSAADLKRVAAQYLIASNRTVAQLTPKGREGPFVRLAAQQGEWRFGEADFGREATAPGEWFDSDPADVESRLIRVVVPSGLRVVLLPKQTRGGSTSAVLNVHRLSPDPPTKEQFWAGRLLARMLARGPAGRSWQQLQWELAKRDSELVFTGDSDQLTVRLSTTRANLVPCLRLLSEILRQPSFTPSDFHEVKRAISTESQRLRSDPESIASAILFGGLYPLPRDSHRPFQSLADRDGSLNRISLHDVKRLYAGFWPFGRAELAVVGALDEQDVRRASAELFGNRTKSRVDRPAGRRSFNPTEPIHRLVETPGFPNSVVLAALPIPLREDSPDYPAVTFGAYLLGGGFFNSRLALRLQRNEGLSYSVQTRLSGGPRYSISTLLTLAECDPGSMGRVTDALREELARVRSVGFTQDEVNSGKKAWLEEQRLARRRDEELASQLARDAFTGRTQQWTSRLWERVGALDAEVVNAAMRRYLQISNLNIVAVGDFAGRGRRQAGT